jgi:hypothetical protein
VLKRKDFTELKNEMSEMKKPDELQLIRGRVYVQNSSSDRLTTAI